MKLRFIISSSLILLITLNACTRKPVKGKPKVDEKKIEDVSQGDADNERRPGHLKVIFKNDRTALEYNIDPNDEDIYIQLSGGEVEAEVLVPKKESPQPQPIQITQTVQTPQAQQPQNSKPPELDIPKKEDVEEELDQGVGIPEEDPTNRVLSDISKAQQALYNNELGKAEKLVRNSLGIRETAKGFALLGTIHYMRKDNRRALDSWQRSLSIEPDQPQIKNMIYKVERQGN